MHFGGTGVSSKWQGDHFPVMELSRWYHQKA